MKKIGFIDYYISEWHANNYPKWISEASERLGEDFKVSYAWAELDVSPVDGVTTDEWCEKFGVERCASIAELCEKSDYICILAPSNPEKHLSYAGEAFPFAKNTYVDKTFAPTYAEACEIFALGKQYGTRFFSTSALRYAEELCELSECQNLIVTGSGSNFDEYFIHMAEMAVKLLGTDLVSVSAHSQSEKQCTVMAEFLSGKRATMVFSPSLPYSACAEFKGGTTAYRKIESKYFLALIEDILRFFTSGREPFDQGETLTVMKLREEAIRSRTDGGVSVLAGKN